MSRSNVSDITTRTYTINGEEYTRESAEIKNGLRADLMRKQMESKNTLAHKGSLYKGTGISTGGDICVTEELQISDAAMISSDVQTEHYGKVLMVGTNGDIGWTKELPALGNTVINGSLSVTGDVDMNGTITGTLDGTATNAVNTGFSNSSWSQYTYPNGSTGKIYGVFQMDKFYYIYLQTPGSNGVTVSFGLVFLHSEPAGYAYTRIQPVYPGWTRYDTSSVYQLYMTDVEDFCIEVKGSNNSWTLVKEGTIYYKEIK